MRRLVIAASRMTAVHTPTLAAELREEVPGARIEAIRLGHGALVAPAAALEARARVRARLGIPLDALVLGVFGGLTPEKRLPQILDAFRALLPYSPGAHLLLAGGTASHYDLEADLAARGLPFRRASDGAALRDVSGSTAQRGGSVTLTGYIDGEEALTDTIATADVALNLRWPSAREMSGPWLRALAAGVPTITLDLVHTAQVPSLDPRTWLRQGGTGPSAVTVAIDILDEDHSLRLAMRRLASDAALRAELAAAGRAYWEREHSVERMVDDYRRLLPLAAASPRPLPDLPAHLVTDGGPVLQGLLEELGMPDRNPLSGVH